MRLVWFIIKYTSVCQFYSLDGMFTTMLCVYSSSESAKIIQARENDGIISLETIEKDQK